MGVFTKRVKIWTQCFSIDCSFYYWCIFNPGAFLVLSVLSARVAEAAPFKNHSAVQYSSHILHPHVNTTPQNKARHKGFSCLTFCFYMFLSVWSSGKKKNPLSLYLYCLSLKGCYVFTFLSSDIMS